MSTTDPPGGFDDLVAEISQRHRGGRILVAVDGIEADSTRRFADTLAEAARASGAESFRASAERPDEYTSDDAPLLRTLLAAFRNGALQRGDLSVEVPADAMLIVDGRFLLNPRLRGSWHFRVWLDGNATLSNDDYEQQLRYVRDQEPRGAADAIYDISGDPPTRIFSDSC